MGYHLLSARIGKEWYKLPHIYGEKEFDALVAAADGYLPLGVQAFHFDNPNQLLRNNVIEARLAARLPPKYIVIGEIRNEPDKSRAHTESAL